MREASACKQAGEIGALQRREGLYSSHLAAWRTQLQRGSREGIIEVRVRSAGGPLD